MIVVEGADRVGKTTFCKALIKRAWKAGIPCVYQSFGVLPPTWDYPSSYFEFITKYGVMDRFIMSEIAYGRVCRDGPMLGWSEYQLVQAIMTSKASLTVLLTTEDEVLSETYDRVGDDLFRKDQVLRVNRAFCEIANEDPSWKKYRAVVDVRHHRTREEQWPAENGLLLETVVQAWKKLLHMTERPQMKMSASVNPQQWEPHA
jgi:thymidylate kinase